MDENVIFSKPDSTSQKTSGDASATSAPSPIVPSVQQTIPQAPIENPVPPVIPPPVTPSPAAPESPLPPPPPPRSSPLKGILKIVVAILAIFFVVIVFVVFILPRFKKTTPESAVTLTYWGLFEDKNVMNSIIASFEHEHPSIKINYIQKDVKQYRQSLVTQINNGTGPDLFRFHNSWTGMMRPYLSPMTTDVISSSDLKKNYYPVIQQDLVRNGALYGIPLEIDTLALFVNPDLLQKAGDEVPTTWDQFVKVAKDMVVKDANGKIQTAGAAMGTYDNVTHAPDILAMLMAQNGTNFNNFSATPNNTAQALQFYTAFAQSEGSVWDDTLDPSITAFAKGNLAMYFGYSWDIFTIQALNPDLNFKIYPSPNLPNRKSAIASYWAEGVSAKSPHQKEAMLFMKYLTQKNTLQNLYTEESKTRKFGEPYPLVELAASVKNNPFVYPFLQQAPYATSSYFASDTDDDGINAQMNAYLGNAVRSVLNDNSSAQSAVDTLAQGVNQVLAKYGR
ncbi:MAG TPA: sugar ABC transporter substrate-binding protein, partial [Patescibacteria group bacterium]|nr:sugar ABC transporter substrate-binding protein [Patescibacteria group bacterium]